jgi:glycerate kinase
MKVLIVPDSFKGTLTSKQACECIEKGLKAVDKNIQITSLPFSDGGEGFSECLANFCKADILYTWCSDIYGKRIKGHIYTYDKTAIIDCATASGLQKKKEVMEATSYGTGELIKFAYTNGFKNIILGLGGTGCCDGGAGAISALGGVFKDIEGDEIEYPCGKDLESIFGINLRNCVKDIHFTYACDVSNEFYGKNGASFVYAKQKGASDENIIHLDNGLKMINAFLPNDVSKVKGAGSAGGICGGLYSIYGGQIKSGFDILADACKLEEKIKDADIVVTGEGKTDEQTLMGKLPYKISQLCKKYDKKCVVISGIIDGVSIGDKCISLVDKSTTIEQAMNNAEKTLENKSKYILQ